MIDTTGLSKAQVLCALYNASKPQGMGFIQYKPGDMTIDEADRWLKQSPSQDFDYLLGRVMKVCLSRDGSFEEWGYDRDNGQGAAQRAIDAARKGDQESIHRAHKAGVEQSAALAHNAMHQPTRYSNGVITLGLNDVKDQLAPAVKRAKDAVRE